MAYKESFDTYRSNHGTLDESVFSRVIHPSDLRSHDAFLPVVLKLRESNFVMPAYNVVGTLGEIDRLAPDLPLAQKVEEAYRIHGVDASTMRLYR